MKPYRSTNIRGLLGQIAVIFLFSLGAVQTRAQENTTTGTGALQSNTTGTDNTADGYNALFSNTSGSDNTAVGLEALPANTSGSRDTAVGATALHNNIGSDNSAFGYNALYFNDFGIQNTALGSGALYSNTQGNDNTAIGYEALFSNTTGSCNTATGVSALSANTDGTYNTAIGYQALAANTSGGSNTAFGSGALAANTTASFNVAVGVNALCYSTAGTYNTAIGAMALSNPSFTGSGDTAIGYGAGSAATTATNSIYINSPGSSSDGSVIDIGTQGTQTVTTIAGIYGEAAANGVAVYINSNGQLGTAVSSARFKDDIRDMGDASSELFSLRPVAFRYKPEIDPKGIAQYGLIAEEVEKIDPSLVVHDPDGKPYSVRYEQVNAMLLNEFLKQHKEVYERHAKIAALKDTDARQQSEMEAAKSRDQRELEVAEAQEHQETEALRAALKEQEAVLERVLTEVALGRPAIRTADNSQ
jgi:hypothetical protein